jgi:hypothetical protein
VNLEPDKAYVLVRTTSEKFCSALLCRDYWFGPILIRFLTADELQQASVMAEQDPRHWKDTIEANVVEMQASQPYAEEGGQRILMMALKPGVYLLGGIALANDAKHHPMFNSLCMGSVKFEARPGVITDLGTMLVARDDQPTTIPELSSFVSGKPALDDGSILVDVALRPDTDATQVPSMLKTFPVVAADYRAVPPIPNFLGANIGRIAPLPGVLAYDKDGEVIDLKSGRSSHAN